MLGSSSAPLSSKMHRACVPDQFETLRSAALVQTRQPSLKVVKLVDADQHFVPSV